MVGFSDDEGHFNEVGGRGRSGPEFHFGVRERPTTGFEAPGLREWAVQANVDPSSSIEAASGPGCPMVISIVTLV